MVKCNVLVHGIGITGTKYPSHLLGKQVREYCLWHHMLLRCTEKFQAIHQTYVGTTCSENFKNYSFFYEWCQEQTGFNAKDEKGRSWQLDKDLLAKSSKLYSEDTCVFIPHSINSLIIKCDSVRGEHPLGVCWSSAASKFRAYCREGNGKRKHLGLFIDSDDAFQAYKTHKEFVVKQIAEDYKTQLDERVYAAMKNYTVDILN